MKDFYFLNNDQMSNAEFARWYENADCERYWEEAADSLYLIESEGFWAALSDDIETVTGNRVDAMEQMEQLHAALDTHIRSLPQQWTYTRQWVRNLNAWMLDWIMSNGIKSKLFGNYALAKEMHLAEENAA